MPREPSHRPREDDPDDELDRDHDRERRHRRRHSSRAHEEYEERRRRRGHRATDSAGELLGRSSRSRDPVNTADTTPRRPSPSHRRKKGRESSSRRDEEDNSPLNLAALAQLNKQNNKKGWSQYDYDAKYLNEVRAKERRLEAERVKEERKEKRRQRERELDPRKGVESENDGERRIRYKDNVDDTPSRRRDYYTDNDGHERKKRYGDPERERRHRRNSGGANDARRKKRVVSGPLLEEGGKEDGYGYTVETRGGGGGSEGSSEDEEAKRKKKKRLWIIGIAITVLIVIIIIVAAVVASKKKGSSVPESNAAASSDAPANENLKSISKDSIPASAKGTILDPFTWYDTDYFNVTFTDATVGGLPLMGLNSTWDDSVQANDQVPPLDQEWEYGTMPVRGVNLGGWLNLEPFITPSFFESFATRDGVIDEYTLTQKLGATRSLQSLEKHYSAFARPSTFAEIRAAGFDHIRISFGYWMVTTYDGDPYVAKVSWRYLLRGIEWARQHGLRVNLDLHGAPGSQNGWNHSGRQGVIGWLNGTDGDLNGQRTLDIHNQLSTFFAQPRYRNIVTMYGILNEPRMVELNTNSVITWTEKAISVIRGNNITAVLVFGDGFMGLDNWKGKLQNYDNLLLDVHQYVIFNTDQLKLNHKDKLNFACAGWTAQSVRSMNKQTGFGPTMCGEWSQADTDCTQYINNVGIGSRWEGTLNTGNASSAVLSPVCPTNNSPQCQCGPANADPSTYSDVYKRWLLQFAEAQMESFEKGWGWFYWTWDTEKATQWSWRRGLAAGILPKDPKVRAFNCNNTIEDFAASGLPEYY